MQLIKLVWTITFFSGIAAFAQEAPQPQPTRPSDRNQMLETLAETIGKAVRRTDTQHPVFHGCVDWHSAVHGHWALLRIAATTGKDDELAKWVASALTPDGIVAEGTYLREHPEFEMPYGRVVLAIGR